jgi:hypothetical protein
MTKDKSSVTMVGEHRQTFVKEAELHGLKRAVSVLLAEASMQHQQAAKRAGVGRVYWSRLLGSERITMHELKTLAKGCGVSAASLIARCKAPPRAA